MTRHAGAYHTPAPRPAGQGAGPLWLWQDSGRKFRFPRDKNCATCWAPRLHRPARRTARWPGGAISGRSDHTHMGSALCATAPQFSLFGRDVLQSRGIVIIYRRRKQLLARNLKTT